MRKAVCLLSGELDSTVCLYAARAQKYAPIALSVDYAQRHRRELVAARSITRKLKIPHYVIKIAMPWKGSALTTRKAVLPKNRHAAKIPKEIPVTYVPGRNSIFLSLAMACAEARQAEAIFFGANVLDYSGYPDCRPVYLKAFAGAVLRGTKIGAEGKRVEIKAPLLRLTKKEIVRLGQRLRVPFEKTWSCYEGGRVPCGTCDSCLLRAKGFREAGVTDPLVS